MLLFLFILAWFHLVISVQSWTWRKIYFKRVNSDDTYQNENPIFGKNNLHRWKGGLKWRRDANVDFHKLHENNFHEWLMQFLCPWCHVFWYFCNHGYNVKGGVHVELMGWFQIHHQWSITNQCGSTPLMWRATKYILDNKSNTRKSCVLN